MCFFYNLHCYNINPISSVSDQNLSAYKVAILLNFLLIAYACCYAKVDI